MTGGAGAVRIQRTFLFFSGGGGVEEFQVARKYVFSAASVRTLTHGIGTG